MTNDLELRLRNRFQAARLPDAPASLRDFLYDLPVSQARPRHTWRPSPLLLAATLGALLLLALGAIFVASRPTNPPPSPNPDPDGLLQQFPAATVVFTRSVGTANAAVSDDATVETIDAGFTPPLQGPFVMGGSCRGPGAMSVELRSPAGVGPIPSAPATPLLQGGPPLLQLDVPCDGSVGHNELPFATVSTSLGVYVTVRVPAGASWRIAVGEYPPELAQEPSSRGTLTQTPGWTVLHDFSSTNGLVTLLNPTGFAVNVPGDTTRLGVRVWCTGSAGLLVRAGEDSEAVACPTDDDGERVEFAVDGGDSLDLSALPDSPVHLRVLVEADIAAAQRWPSPPDMPADVADASYASATGGLVGSGRLAAGRLGSNQQVVVQAEGAVFATAKGDYVLVQRADGGSPLELWNVDPLERVRALVEPSADGQVFQAWFDLAHEQVVYSLARQTGEFEIRRVGLDGTGDRLLGNATVGEFGIAGRLALDDSVLAIEACSGTETCSRWLVELESGETSELAVDAGPDGFSCSLAGVSDGVVIRECFDAVSGEGHVLDVSNLDGTGQRVLVESLQDLIGLVRTDDGPFVVYARPTPAGELRYEAMNVATGEARVLYAITADDPRAGWRTVDVSLPPNWLLFGGELGDFPGQSMALGPVPRLVNVLTAETIDLINLPHAGVEGTFP